MKITIASVGKIRRGPFKKLADDYHERLRYYRPVALVDVRESSAELPEQRQRDEATSLWNAVPSGATTVVLDERGRQWTSEDFAGWIEEQMVRGTRHLAFVVGGPEGHTDETRQQADVLLALSSFTYPHDLARVVLAEQLYRAFTIVRGEPYHR